MDLGETVGKILIFCNVPQQDCRGGWHESGSQGLGANQGREDKLLREHMTADLAQMDASADSMGFSEQDWAWRYALEARVEALLKAEEEY